MTKTVFQISASAQVVSSLPKANVIQIIVRGTQEAQFAKWHEKRCVCIGNSSEIIAKFTLKIWKAYEYVRQVPRF